jgi:GntR family transcriptional regulator
MAPAQSHLSAQRVPGLPEALRQAGSLDHGRADNWQVRAVETIQTPPASPREAELPATHTGAPMLILSRHSFEADGAPVEWLISRYRGDRYTFVATLGGRRRPMDRRRQPTRS